MEKLIVKNFLNLEDIELDVKKINIVIGRQAEGKSILAKLLFFFKDCFFDFYRQNVYLKTHQKYEKKARLEFEKIFPRYMWKHLDFTLTYQYEDYYITVTHQTQFEINYSDTFNQAVEYLKQHSLDEMYDLEYLARQKLSFLEEYLVFIPAGRSFFSTIEANIFSLLAEDVKIDYLMQRFGAYYERRKDLYYFKNLSSHHAFYLSNKILKGRYQKEQDRDFLILEDTKQKIHVSNASSGQQEALPMLIILTTLNNRTFSSFRHFILIEEPEAHLFPTAQRDIINLISHVFNLREKQNRFFITTHSPYILTAFNNLIQAGNTRKAIQQRENSKQQLKKLYSIIPKEQILDIEDIGAYLLENGRLQSIIDPENQIIDAHIIDEVSNSIFDTFQQLVDLEIEE